MKSNGMTKKGGDMPIHYRRCFGLPLAISLRDGFIKTGRPAEGYSSRSGSNRV